MAARTNQHGKDIRRVLRWLTNRNIQDAEMAAAHGMPAATYSRNKDGQNFPSFEQLAMFGAHFGCSARVLQIAFGWRGEDELVLLDEDEMGQYIEQGGGVSPLTAAGHTDAANPSTTNRRRGRRGQAH
jgi:hypothetical protein